MGGGRSERLPRVGATDPSGQTTCGQTKGLTMGFMDQVKAAANDLKDSVEGSLASGNSARDVERHYRDLGMLTYLQDTGRAIDAADRERIVAALRAAEAAGAMTAFTLQTGAPPPPPHRRRAVRCRRTPASSRRPHRPRDSATAPAASDRRAAAATPRRPGVRHRTADLRAPFSRRVLAAAHLRPTRELPRGCSRRLVVHEAPAPVLAGLGGLHDGVRGLAEVRRGVLVG